MIPPDAGWALPPSDASDATTNERDGAGRGATSELWAREGVQNAHGAGVVPQTSATPHGDAGIRGRLGALASGAEQFASASAGPSQPGVPPLASSAPTHHSVHPKSLNPARGDAGSSGGPSFPPNGSTGDTSRQTTLHGHSWAAYPPAPVMPPSQTPYLEGWQTWQAGAPSMTDSRATIAGLGQLHAVPEPGIDQHADNFSVRYPLAPNDSYGTTSNGTSHAPAMPDASTIVPDASHVSPFTFDLQQQQAMQALFNHYSAGWPGTATSPDLSSSTTHVVPPTYPYPPGNVPVDPVAALSSTDSTFHSPLYPIAASASSAPAASRSVSSGEAYSLPAPAPYSLPPASLPPPQPTSSNPLFHPSAEASSSVPFNTDIFASKRTRRVSSAATATGMNLPAALGQAGDMVKNNSNPQKKLTVDLPAVCVVCSEPIARLICRGKRAELNVPHAAAFTCVRCWESSNDASPMAEYSPDVQTCALPAEDAGSPVAGPSRRPSLARTKAPSFRRRNKRLDDRSTPTACDVCLRDIAVGGVLPLPLDDPPANAKISFMIEVVCSSCDSRYRRCTDCGGGGGARAGTGKWRAKELFTHNRKTCVLNHQRLGAFPAMEYSVWRNTDIPRDEVDELSGQLKALFVNAMLAGLCIPEVMEQDGAIWTTYAEAAEHAHGGWFGFDPILRNDIEPTHNIRRYLALRTCTPNLRKTSKPSKSKASNASTSELPEDAGGMPLPPVGSSRAGTVLKEGREIAGFVLAESELSAGSLFLALVLPWDPTGEIFDATSLMLSSLVQRADADIRALNAEKLARGEPLLPSLRHVWTMMFFKPSSRVLSSLIKKRGFMLLEDYLQAYPDTSATLFPPHRQIYLPVDRHEGWSILVRRQRENHDGSFLDDWGARRAADEERGKKKEIRAAAVAARERQQRNGG